MPTLYQSPVRVHAAREKKLLAQLEANGKARRAASAELDKLIRTSLGADLLHREIAAAAGCDRSVVHRIATEIRRAAEGEQQATG